MRDNVAIITLDSPPVNALDTATFDALDQMLREIDESSACAVVLTGTGKCFSAGLDLKAVRAMDSAARVELVEALNRCFEHLYRCPRPVIAAVNGHAIAGGVVLALAADHRICVDAPIKLGLAEVRVGIPFPMGALAIVQNELDAAGMRQLALLGYKVDPQRAQQYGVVDELVPGDALLPRALAVATDLAQLPQKAFAAIKSQMRLAALQRIRAVLTSGKDPVFEAWDAEFPR
jgi:enoyl-CoA hydratase